MRFSDNSEKNQPRWLSWQSGTLVMCRSRVRFPVLAFTINLSYKIQFLYHSKKGKRYLSIQLPEILDVIVE